jgi:hypothetical protein
MRSFTFTILLQAPHGGKTKFTLQKSKNRAAVFSMRFLGIFSLFIFLKMPKNRSLYQSVPQHLHSKTAKP